VSFKLPGRAKRSSKKHAVHAARKQLARLMADARKAELQRRGPLFITRPPRTTKEERELQAVCIQKAKLEGCRGKRLRERAAAIYAEVVEESKRSVRAVRPTDHIIVAPKHVDDDLPRTPGGVLVLPYGKGLITPP
jgi:hypothetical protein